MWRLRGGAWTDTPPTSLGWFRASVAGLPELRPPPDSAWTRGGEGTFQSVFKSQVFTWLLSMSFFFFAFRVFTSVFKITSDYQSQVVYSSRASSCLLEIEVGNRQNRKCPLSYKKSCRGRTHVDGSLLGCNCQPLSLRPTSCSCLPGCVPAHQRGALCQHGHRIRGLYRGGVTGREAEKGLRRGR